MRVNETLGSVQDAILGPLRQGTALWAGVRAALAFFASRQERSGRGRPGDDEDESLFIG